MLRGRSVLRDLATELEEAHSRFEEATGGLRRAEKRHRTLLDEEHRTVEELARVYLPDLSPESVASGLDALRNRLDEALAAQEERRERLLTRRARLAAAASVERHRYEEDRLFRYLHDRDYGGPGYRAGPLTRRLDRWLARRMDYETLSRNYRILKVGPHQLGAEIRRLGERAEELEARLNEAQSALDRARSTQAAIHAEQRAIEHNRGRDFEEALELHRDYLEGKTVRELEELARSTPDPRDERLVRRLDEIRRELEGVAQELALRREDMERASEKIERIAELQDAGIQRMAGHNSLFPEGFDIRAVLGAFMSGEAGVEEVVETLADSRTEASIFVEVERPYFDAVYRELTSAFDARVGGAPVVDAEWEMEDGTVTEVEVQDAEGRVLRRRVTRRTLREPPEPPERG